MGQTVLNELKGKYDYICFWDGATEPRNPGGACGIGAVIFDKKGKRLFEYSHFITMHPKNSNNVAEYLGFIELLNWFLNKKIKRKSIIFLGDSNLVVQQMSGYWRMRGGLYFKYALKAKKLLSELILKNAIYIEWIGRDYNDIADELSKRELINNKIQFKLQPV